MACEARPTHALPPSRAQAAAKINDAGAAGQISHRIGLIHQRQGEWHKALACHASFLAASRAAGDRRGEGAACCAHAECQQQLGDLEGAVASLETYLEIARGQVGRQEGMLSCMEGGQWHAFIGSMGLRMDSGVGGAAHAILPDHTAVHTIVAACTQEARGQAVACCKLGAIHYGQGRWEQAVSRYEHAFELARGLPDRRLLDAVRTNLGIARAALREGAYFQVCAPGRRGRLGALGARRGKGLGCVVAAGGCTSDVTALRCTMPPPQPSALQAVAAGELGALLSMKANPTGVGRADAA